MFLVLSVVFSPSFAFRLLTTRTPRRALHSVLYASFAGSLRFQMLPNK